MLVLYTSTKEKANKHCCALANYFLVFVNKLLICKIRRGEFLWKKNGAPTLLVYSAHTMVFRKSNLLFVKKNEDIIISSSNSRRSISHSFYPLEHRLLSPPSPGLTHLHSQLLKLQPTPIASTVDAIATQLLSAIRYLKRTSTRRKDLLQISEVCVATSTLDNSAKITMSTPSLLGRSKCYEKKEEFSRLFVLVFLEG